MAIAKALTHTATTAFNIQNSSVISPQTVIFFFGYLDPEYGDSKPIRNIGNTNNRYGAISRTSTFIKTYLPRFTHASHSKPWQDIIKTDLREVGGGGAWTGSIWLRIGPGGGLL
jgi:hypothetical protein